MSGIQGKRKRRRRAPSDAAPSRETSEHAIVDKLRIVGNIAYIIMSKLKNVAGARTTLQQPLDRLGQIDLSGDTIDFDAMQNIISDMAVEASMTVLSLSKPRVRDDVDAEINRLIDVLLREIDYLVRSFASRSRIGSSRVACEA